MSGRTGYRSPAAITGDRSDLAGFPRLIGEFCEHMAARGYSERTIGNRRHMLSYLVAWLAERGITRPAEVTRPVLESYQRHLFHYRKSSGDPLSFRSQSQRCSRSGRSTSGPPGSGTCCTTPPARSSCPEPSGGCPARR